MCRSLAFDFQFDGRRAAGVEHQSQIERAICLRFEADDFLGDSLLGELERALGEADDWLAFVVGDAGEDTDEVRLHADRAFLALLLLLRIRSADVSERSERQKRESAKRGDASFHL